MEARAESRIGRELWRTVNDAIAAGCRRACEKHATFVCECDSSNCLDRFDVSLSEYERIRAEPELFLLATAHHRPSTGAVRIGEGYAVFADAASA